MARILFYPEGWEEVSQMDRGGARYQRTQHRRINVLPQAAVEGPEGNDRSAVGNSRKSQH